MLEIIHQWGNPQQLLFLGPGFHHWISTDYGATFETIATPGDTLGFWNQIKTHPRQPEWLAAQVRRKACLEAGARTNIWCAWDLFISKVFSQPPPPPPPPPPSPLFASNQTSTFIYSSLAGAEWLAAQLWQTARLRAQACTNAMVCLGSFCSQGTSSLPALDQRSGPVDQLRSTSDILIRDDNIQNVRGWF